MRIVVFIFIVFLVSTNACKAIDSANYRSYPVGDLMFNCPDFLKVDEQRDGLLKVSDGTITILMQVLDEKVPIEEYLDRIRDDTAKLHPKLVFNATDIDMPYLLDANDLSKVKAKLIAIKILNEDESVASFISYLLFLFDGRQYYFTAYGVDYPVHTPGDSRVLAIGLMLEVMPQQKE